MPDGRKWVVERDGSVTDPSAEVVSPVCRWEDLPMVLAVAKAIRAAGARTDGSCGIHVHVGLGEHTPQSLRRLVNIVNAKEDLLTQHTSTCRIGVAHNGIIQLTSDPDNHRYSDTALFITQYLTMLIKRREDLRDQRILDTIWRLAQSKFAILDGGGYIATVGQFLNRDGLLFSNASFQGWRYR